MSTKRKYTGGGAEGRKGAGGGKRKVRFQKKDESEGETFPLLNITLLILSVILSVLRGTHPALLAECYNTSVSAQRISKRSLGILILLVWRFPSLPVVLRVSKERGSACFLD